jgi:hypothetical protein
MKGRKEHLKSVHGQVVLNVIYNNYSLMMKYWRCFCVQHGHYVWLFMLLPDKFMSPDIVLFAHSVDDANLLDPNELLNSLTRCSSCGKTIKSMWWWFDFGQNHWWQCWNAKYQPSYSGNILSCHTLISSNYANERGNGSCDWARRRSRPDCSEMEGRKWAGLVMVVIMMVIFIELFSGLQSFITSIISC